MGKFIAEYPSVPMDGCCALVLGCMNIHSVIALCAGSIAFCVGIYHFMYSGRLRNRHVDLAFAGTCFAAGFYALASSLLYSVDSVARGMVWQRWQFVLLCAMGASFLWFVSEFIGRKNRRLDYLFAGYWLVQAVVLTFDRSNLTLESVATGRSFDFLGLFPVTYYEGAPGVLVGVQTLVGILVCIYIMYSLVVFYRQDKENRAMPIIIGMSVFIAGVISDGLVGAGIYNCIYVMEVAFLVMLVCMGYSLNEIHFENQQKLHDATAGLRQLEAAVDAAAESIVITDLDGSIQYVNPAFEGMTGYGRDEVIGKTSGVVKSGKHREDLYKELWDTISLGGVWRGHFTNRKKDGSLFQEDAVISPIKNRDGKIVNFVAVKRDVTQEVQLENQLRQSQKMEALGRLASGVAHDFTNMLAVIMGHTQLLKAKFRSDAECGEHLDSIVDSAGRLSSLTGDLLAFAHQKPLALKISDLNRVIGGMMAMLHRSIDKNVELVVNTCEGKLLAELDPAHIEQALMYLVVNAVDVMPDGGRLTIATEQISLTKNEVVQFQDGMRGEETSGGSFAVVSVTDTGCGMSEEVRARVFEPFFTTKGKARTTGLGLSTTYGIVSQHNGNITVYSAPGQGTTFKIYLPLTQPYKGSEAEAAPGKVDVAGNTILAAEDDFMVRRVLIGILQRMGYSVLEAEDSVQAKSLFAANEGDIGLMITDVMMPETGGVQLAEDLRAIKPGLKVIFASGYPEDHLRQLGVITDGEIVMSKPLSQVAIAAAIEQVMNK